MGFQNSQKECDQFRPEDARGALLDSAAIVNCNSE